MTICQRLRPVAAGVALLAATAASARAEGMPQLDFANPLTVAQVVWLAIILLVLYLLLSRWALPQVADVLELRATAIANDLNAARQAKADADAAIAEQSRATQEAHAGAQAEISQAVAAAKAATDKETATLAARLDAQIADAEQRIAQARASAMNALQQVASETALDVVRRLTGAAISDDAVHNAVASVLAARTR